MRWILIRLSLMIVLLFVAISAAVLIGYQQPPSPRVSMLYLNAVCRLPCWLGITPYITSLTEGGQKIVNFYGKLPNYIIEYDRGGRVYIVKDKASKKLLYTIYLSDFRTEKVVGIDIIFPPATNFDPSVGELMAVLGQPTSISVGITDTTTSLLYEQYRLGLLIGMNDMQCNSVIQAISCNPAVSVPTQGLVIDDVAIRQASYFYSPQVWTGFHQYHDLNAIKGH